MLIPLSMDFGRCDTAILWMFFAALRSRLTRRVERSVSIKFVSEDLLSLTPRTSRSLSPEWSLMLTRCSLFSES